MGIASRSVLGSSIAATVVVVAGMVSRDGGDRQLASDLPSTRHAEHATQPSLGGHAPGLTPQPAAARAEVDPAAPSPGSPSCDLHVYAFDLDDDPIEATLHIDTPTSSRSVHIPATGLVCSHDVTSDTRLYLRAESLKANLWSRPRTVNASPGSTHEVNLRLRGPRFRGRVLDAKTEQPVSGARIIPREPGPRMSQTGGTSGVSSPQGEFDMELSPSDHGGGPQLRVLHDDYLPRAVPRPDSADPIDILLEPRPRCSGRVRLHGGGAAHRAEIRLRVTSTVEAVGRLQDEHLLREARLHWVARGCQGAWGEVPVDDVTTLTTSADGTFDHPLAFPGEVVGYVRLPGHLVERFAVTERERCTPVDVTLEPSPEPNGRVRFARPDGTAFRHLQVTVSEATDEGRGATIQVMDVDDDGWLDTSALREGSRVNIAVAYKPPGSHDFHTTPMAPFVWAVRQFDTIKVERK
ncbi:MAG: hypothetical protein R3F05_19105 [Planctomycetota bacterium]